MRWLSLIPVLLCSCFLQGPHFRQASFHYTENNIQQQIPLELPKDHTSEKTVTDSAGNTSTTYRYGKALFYVAYVQDTLQAMQPIDTSMNIPRIHPLGGLIYKGMNEDGTFWREIRRQHLRFGYQNVPRASEYLFDSVTNYASGIRPK
jgi:hypothetical protein